MITIEDILSPKFVNLEIGAPTVEQAIFEVASLLKGHRHVHNWQGFYDSLKTGDPIMQSQRMILIPHARTEHVSSMVMSVGRAGDVLPEIDYIFVVGVPVAMAADYLRIMGAIGRIVRHPSGAQALWKAKSPKDFIQVLASMELPLQT